MAIHPAKSRDFVRELFNLERKFWKVTEPYEFEIKGRLLMGHAGMTSLKKQEFCEEVLSLCKTHGIKLFAVGIKNAGTLTMTNLDDPVIYRAYSRLLERVEAMMVEEYPEDMAIVALDSSDQGTDTKRARTFGNFLYGSITGKSCAHIIETPLFVSSAATTGIQIADMVAYALAQQNLAREDLRHIGDRIRELEWRSNRTDMEYPMRGFRFEEIPKT
ncbi:MAG: DUF3800 domain-containing protein [Chloroflexi bacterium]|nr:DUF3800 domain-containing protein [Chloroflexota bacterium]